MNKKLVYQVGNNKKVILMFDNSTEVNFGADDMCDDGDYGDSIVADHFDTVVH